jgi:predicted aspartyl protease
MRGLPGVVKLDLASGVPVVEATIDGKPLRLVVDTGASWSLLRPEAVTRLGLETRASEELKARDAAGEVRAVDAAHVDALRLETISDEGAAEPIELGDFDLVVLESPVVKAAGADGILGLPLFRRMVARFDFDAQRLELGGESLPSADDGRTLAIRATEGGLVTIPGQFVAPQQGPEPAPGGEPRDFLVDTGFSGFVHLPAAAAEELTQKAPAGCAGVASTAHRQREFERILLDHDLSLGRYRVLRPVASVFVDAKERGDGALGTGLLRHFTLTLDLPRRRLRLEAPQDEVHLEEKRRLQPGSQD